MFNSSRISEQRDGVSRSNVSPWSCKVEVRSGPTRPAPMRPLLSLRSLDHLVGGHEQLVGHAEAEHPGGLGVDDQLELRGLYDWQVRGLRALEDAAGIDAPLTIRIRQAGSGTQDRKRVG